jgi:hypothetical protein
VAVGTPAERLRRHERRSTYVQMISLLLSFSLTGSVSISNTALVVTASAIVRKTTPSDSITSFVSSPPSPLAQQAAGSDKPNDCHG